MSASQNLKAKIVRVEIKDENGLFVATSPDLKGFLAASRELGDLRQVEIPESIIALYAACGVDVVVTEVEDDHKEWVAVPVAVAKRALEQRHRA